MSELPMTGKSQEEQQRLMNQMYLLLGKQVKSYHHHRHMGENSSVPVELAQELMQSVAYTLSLAENTAAGGNLEEMLHVGQNLLDARVRQAKQKLDLVYGTAPQWQTECRWDALTCLGAYLSAYDHRHLAHRIPDELFYPILVPVPDMLKGIDYCLFCLNIMWLENQIMAGVPAADAEALWDRLHQDTLNQCEQLLNNGIGKAMIHTAMQSLVFEEAERRKISSALRGRTSDEIRDILSAAASKLCGWLDLSDENAAAYVRRAAAQLVPRLQAALQHDNLAAVFI